MGFEHTCEQCGFTSDGDDDFWFPEVNGYRQVLCQKCDPPEWENDQMRVEVQRRKT